MQDLDGITPDQFRAAGQEPLMKIEIYIDDDWTDLNSFSAKKVVEGANVSLGGASMTPNPVEGTWGASLFNQDSVFHPQHPTSIERTYLTTERLVRISIGAKYGDEDKYWPRMIGYMDEPKFNSSDYRVTLSGGDYMKRLRETEFRHLHNYWGSIWTTSSISSEGKSGVEQYNEADAMDIAGEVGNVANWVNINVLASTFDPLADVTGGSAFVGQFITTDVYDPEYIPTVVNDNIFVPIIDTHYEFDFKYIRIAGVPARLRVRIRQDVGGVLVDLAEKDNMWSLTWQNEQLFFTTRSVNPIQIWLEIYEGPIGSEYWFDQFSIFTFTPYWERYYKLRTVHDANEKGVHHVTLKPNAVWEDVWQGEEDEGWYYAEDAEAGPDPPAHPAGIVFLDPNKAVAAGVDNLKIYYYLATAPEDAIARMLYMAGVFNPATPGVPYGSEVAAKAAMIAAPGDCVTGITIDKIWFNPGTTYLEAIQKFCERGNNAGVQYVFYFTYDGQPVFKPRPTIGDEADFTFTDPKQIESISGPYQARSEIKNRIVIKGYRQAEPVSRDETRPSQLVDERAADDDGDSIELYGERTLTIDNHLFQELAPITAMCITLLAKYKDPKWYSDITIPFTALPMELYNTLQWKERLSHDIADITQKGLIRDIKIDNFGVTYKCELQDD